MNDNKESGMDIFVLFLIIGLVSISFGYLIGSRYP